MPVEKSVFREKAHYYESKIAGFNTGQAVVFRNFTTVKKLI